MKITVCILIIFLSAIIGNGFQTDIKRRCESLEALQQICKKMQSEISFRSPPLCELMAKYSTDSRCGRLFFNTEINMKNGFPSAWRHSAQKWAKAIGLTAEETDTVMILDSLGSTDIEGEKLLLSNVTDRLSEHMENTRNELKTKGKMLFSCSVLGGLALVIFII